MHFESKQEALVKPPTCQSIDWYGEGEVRVVHVEGIEVRIRFIGRRGRRGHIAVEAPAGAVFQTLDERK
jgi:hypothetical protein